MRKIQSTNIQVIFSYDANKINASFYMKTRIIFVLSDGQIVRWRNYLINTNMAVTRTFKLGAEY
jgi:hypothetical protein